MKDRTDIDIAPELREAVSRFLIPLQTMQSVDVAAFEHLHALFIDLANYYKGKEYVSKSILNELNVTIKIVLSEIDHRQKDRQILQDMSAKLQTCFDLLLIGEAPGDRKPGVPRIM